MSGFDERLNGLRWRLQAMRRLWRPDAEPQMTFLAPQPPEEEAMGELDHPLPEMEVGRETLTVSGWVAFKVAATSRVEVWLDEHALGRARLGLPRPDIEETKPMAHGATCGFELVADIEEEVLGAELGEYGTVRVVATATDGSRHELGPVRVALRDSAKVVEEKREALPLPAPVSPRSGAGLRTLIATHQLNLGGAQLYLMDLIKGLRERGGFDLVVVSAMDGPLREDLEALGIGVHITSISPFDDLSSHSGHVEELAAWARPQGFEVAFVNTATALSFPAAEAASRLGIPAVWAIHESFEPAVLWGHLDPDVRESAEATLTAASYAVFEADATQRIFEPVLGAERCRMLPYGLDLAPIDARRQGFDAAAARREAGLPADARVVVCIGTVEPRKAQISLAQAFEQIAGKHPEAHLAFVGGRKKDPYSQTLEKRIEASPHREQMRLIPITPDVEPWYGMADLLVCASDVESLPRTVLEAMAWETPVLATSVFGLPELIEHGETGWLCESRDIGELAAGLDQALDASAGQQAAMGRAARLLVERRHALDEYANQVAELLVRAHDEAGAR